MNSSINEPKNSGFKWDLKIQGYILSSFYYGYTCNQILGGWMSAIIGGKKIIGVGITAASLLTILTPLAAECSVYVLITLRITMGFFLGMAFPALHTILANWSPKLERTRLTCLTLSGSPTGALIGMPIAGLIASYLNWQWIFYIFGLFGIKISHPWKAILTSPPYWALIIAHFCESWGYQAIMTQLPTLLSHAFHNDIRITGVQLAVPYFFLMIVTIFAGHLADWLISNNHLTTTMVRKIFICSAFFVQAIFVISGGYVNSSILMIIYLTIGISVGAFMSVNLTVNYLDIAPQHASVLLGIAHTIATIPGIISPILTGYVVKNPEIIGDWTIIFIIGGIISITGGIVYGIFGSGKVQKWADDSDGTHGNYDSK
ncbi:sialin-like [Aphidius gifuensis]|uniref:sialin-like n=1 Tax=Aphidius gifuensis TaxID=684658 RepID=UPI001CDC3D16|nr:sialin-like [Aphidius gifuensis]